MNFIWLQALNSVHSYTHSSVTHTASLFVSKGRRRWKTVLGNKKGALHLNMRGSDGLIPAFMLTRTFRLSQGASCYLLTPDREGVSLSPLRLLTEKWGISTLPVPVQTSPQGHWSSGPRRSSTRHDSKHCISIDLIFTATIPDDLSSVAKMRHWSRGRLSHLRDVVDLAVRGRAETQTHAGWLRAP